MDLKVSVMGAGIWGTVIADMLAKKGCEVRLWFHESELVKQINSKHVNSIYFNDGVIHDGVTAVHDKQSCMEADVIVNAVPVQFIRRTWTSLKPGEEVPLINLSKGIERDREERKHICAFRSVICP